MGQNPNWCVQENSGLLIQSEISEVLDPDRPDDRFSMKIAAEMSDDFVPGLLVIETAMSRVRKICEAAGDDISVSMQDALPVAFNRRRKELEGLRRRESGGKSGVQPEEWSSNPQLAALIQTCSWTRKRMSRSGAWRRRSRWIITGS